MTPQTHPETDDHPDWARPLLERQIAMAGELAEAALEAALLLRDEIKDAVGENRADKAVVLEGLARAFGRAGRSVRLSLMVQARLIKDLEARDRGDHPTTANDPPERVTSIVRVLVEPGPDVEERVRQTREWRERLERERLEREDLSQEEARVDRAMGLNPPPQGEGDQTEPWRSLVEGETPLRQAPAARTPSTSFAPADASASAFLAKIDLVDFMPAKSAGRSSPPPPTGQDLAPP